VGRNDQDVRGTAGSEPHRQLVDILRKRNLLQSNFDIRVGVVKRSDGCLVELAKAWLISLPGWEIQGNGLGKGRLQAGKQRCRRRRPQKVASYHDFLLQSA